MSTQTQQPAIHLPQISKIINDLATRSPSSPPMKIDWKALLAELLPLLLPILIALLQDDVPETK